MAGTTVRSVHSGQRKIESNELHLTDQAYFKISRDRSDKVNETSLLQSEGSTPNLRVPPVFRCLMRFRRWRPHVRIPTMTPTNEQ